MTDHEHDDDNGGDELTLEPVEPGELTLEPVEPGELKLVPAEPPKELKLRPLRKRDE